MTATSPSGVLAPAELLPDAELPDVELPDFALPPELEADAPPPRRDGVRLLVAAPGALRHARFAELGSFLRPGDLVVVNVSATLPAAVDARRADGTRVVAHFSAELDDGSWLVEVRPARDATGPLPDARAAERLRLPGHGALLLLRPRDGEVRRLWVARLELPASAHGPIGTQEAGAIRSGALRYLQAVGRPIRYSYVRSAQPLAQYQTVFARTPGSAEMPSAGRPFTEAVVTELVTRGVQLAPITLHTGVSSQEAGEPPMPERYEVPATTARLVEQTRAAGGRVVAVGTTVTRALESVAAADGRMHPADGWTDLVLGPQRPARVVDGLITGWHAPGASHLRLLQAVAGASLVAGAYAEAVRARYRWHEFGDSCLLLP